MDVGILTTLGGNVAILLCMLAVAAHLRKGMEAMEGRLITAMEELKSNIRDLCRDVAVQPGAPRHPGQPQAADFRDLRRDVVVLQVEMGIVKHHLGIAPDYRVAVSQVQTAAGSSQESTSG